MQINLQNRDEYQWHKISQGWCCYKGTLNGKVLEKSLFEAHLKKCSSKTDIISLLQEINGFFALIWGINECTYMAVDLARSFPLFWKTTEGQTQLTDQLNKHTGKPSFWSKNKSLGHSEFTPGHTTLLHGWNQLQAGELLEIKAGICYLYPWFDHRRKSDFQRNNIQHSINLKEEFTLLIRQQTQRFIQYANGRTIVIPLSGGYDSRYILTALIKEGYHNIKAFTYGLEESHDVQVAKKISQKLAIEWIFVPYTNELFDLFFSKDWENYIDFASNMSSIPQDQDFFALHYLKKTGWLKDGDVISPGYCGDFQAGSYLPGSYFKAPWRKRKSIQPYLYHKFVGINDTKIEQLWTPYLPKAVSRTEEEIISELENWALREYVSKYIINGVRAYEYFNCDWYLPLWDKNFILFWQKVPNKFRQNMKLYRTSLEDFLFKPLGVSFPEDKIEESNINLESLIGQKWKVQLKKYQPSLWHKETPKNENGFSYLTDSIKKQLNSDITENVISHNRIVGYWLHDYLRIHPYRSSLLFTDSISIHYKSTFCILLLHFTKYFL